MNKKLILLVLTLIFLPTMASAANIAAESYYPTPVQAGDYFTIWLRVINSDNNVMTNGAVKFKESYPFTMDPGDEQEQAITKLDAKSSMVQRFKIRVDEQSKEGENQLSFQYKDCEGCEWSEKSFPITVVEAQTMFDVVLQEISTDGVYFAIANVGKNSANAVTVRIPEQEFFKTDLTSASIVGNLNSGDYTTAAFKISPKQAIPSGSAGPAPTKNSNAPSINRTVVGNKDLSMQIDYTDPFGARRSVVKKISINPASLIASGTVKLSTSKTSPGLTSNTWFWVSVVLLLLLFRTPLKKGYRKIVGKK